MMGWRSYIDRPVDVLRAEGKHRTERLHSAPGDFQISETWKAKVLVVRITM